MGGLYYPLETVFVTYNSYQTTRNENTYLIRFQHKKNSYQTPSKITDYNLFQIRPRPFLFEGKKSEPTLIKY